jgi:hypothetical protein
MSAIVELQQTAVTKLSGTRAGFDPASIIVIIEVITQVIKMMQDCKKQPQDAANMMNKPTAMQVALVKLYTARAMGYKAYRDLGPEIVDSLLHAGKSATSTLVETAYSEL